MHAHRTPAEADDTADATVLELLIGDPTPWSLDEIAREIGDRTTAVDAITRLHAAGLAHTFDEFAFATRSARRAKQLDR